MSEMNELIHGSSGLTASLSNYNKWIVEELAKLHKIAGKVFEFGCGAGGLTLALSKLPEVESIVANDISHNVAAYFKNNSKNLSPKISFTNNDVMSKEFVPNLWDISISTNTLEHIADEGPVLRRITLLSKLRKSLILVPAHQSLYGTLDKDGGHFRRYSKQTFEMMVNKNGLKVEQMRYFNLIGTFGWWYQYKFLKITKYDSLSNSLPYTFFDRYIIPVYRPIETFLPKPFGLSLIALVTA